MRDDILNQCNEETKEAVRLGIKSCTFAWVPIYSQILAIKGFASCARAMRKGEYKGIIKNAILHNVMALIFIPILIICVYLKFEAVCFFGFSSNKLLPKTHISYPHEIPYEQETNILK